MTRLRAAALLAALAVTAPGALGALAAQRPPSAIRCADGGVQRLADWESVAGPEFTVRPAASAVTLASMLLSV